MTRRSFGSQYASAGAAGEAALQYLDDVAAIPAVIEAKQAATGALELQPGDRVLEVGCGTGVDLPSLVAAVQPGGAVVGIDHNTAAVEAAQRRVTGSADV